MNFTRESIFISALRGFFNTIAVILGIAVALCIVIIGIGAFTSSISSPDKSTLTLSPDANWDRKLLPSSTPVILKVDLHGVIGMGKLQGDKFKTVLLDSREGDLANNRVKGILLHVDTPGGTATDSAAIYHLLQLYKEKYKVPIYAYVEGICASGGMYICSAADQIYSSPAGIIGSVGVRMGPAFNISELMSMIGIQSLTLTEGKDKDMLNPFRPWKEGEEQSLKTLIVDEYDRFLNVVTSARKNLDKEKLINVYGANVFSAKTAEEYGFIDNGNADYDQTLTALVKAAGIGENEKYQVLEISYFESFLTELKENKAGLPKGKLEHIFPTGTFTNSELSGKLLYLYQP
ncbi:MAG: S49 family peptidase [Verrucomicrobia bacterium]|nr:S49 family peptidase [Verrucomicrobiota bacterium]